MILIAIIILLISICMSAKAIMDCDKYITPKEKTGTPTTRLNYGERMITIKAAREIYPHKAAFRRSLCMTNTLDEKGLRHVGKYIALQGVDITNDHAQGIISAYLQATNNGWRPISEAPRDGTELLLFTAFNQVKVASFKEGRWYYQDDEHCIDRPYYFMPLPNPPKGDVE